MNLQALEGSPLKGHKVKIFAALLHTHLAGLYFRLCN